MDDPLTRSRALFFQGIAHFEAHRLQEARGDFEAALALAPGRPSILANLGTTLFRLNQFDDAIGMLRQANQAEPGQPDVLAALGLSLEATHDWQGAADSLGQLLQLSPRHADLWLTCARCRLRCSDAPGALAALDQAIKHAPENPAPWSEKGSLLRELNQLDAAAACFEKALALGADPELHRFYLAAVSQQGDAAPPRRYVEGLFDDYAADFDDHLVGQLKYQGYERLVAPLLNGVQRFKRVLDLGCGTGLCGKLLHTRADRIDGVDLSRAMLDRARLTGRYHDLIHADVGEYLADTDQRADLVIAADVFGYLSNLQPVLASVRRILEPGGRFAFTVESTSSGREIELLPSLRHAHSEAYVRRIADICGFTIMALETAPLRDNQRDPVLALYVYLQ